MIEIYKGNLGSQRRVSRSKNLRGLSRYASKHGVASVFGSKISNGGGALHIQFKDDAYAYVYFESPDVMRNFVWRRRFSWSVSGGDTGPDTFIYRAAP